MPNENDCCSMRDCHWCRVRWFTPIGKKKKKTSNSCVILTSGSLGIQRLYFFYLISSFQNVIKMWPATSTRCTTAWKDKTIWDLSLLQCSSGPSSKKTHFFFPRLELQYTQKEQKFVPLCHGTEWQTSLWSHPLSLTQHLAVTFLIFSCGVWQLLCDLSDICNGRG